MHEHGTEESLRTQDQRARSDQTSPVSIEQSLKGGPLATPGLNQLQRQAGNASVSSFVAQREGDGDEESPVRSVVEGGGGQSLDENTKETMESRLGHDFSDVRIHSDSAASDSAKSVNANAYTVGNNVVFREGHYSPDTESGQKTLAHELTHVVQQRQGPVPGTDVGGGIAVSHPDDPFERQAVAVADSFTSEAPAPATTGADTGGASLQREAEDTPGDPDASSLQRQEEEEEEMQA